MTSMMPLRVLIIDDNEFVLDALSSLARFSNPSWALRTAPDHDAGMEIAKIFMPHVICADIGRISKPGLAFAQGIRQDKSLKNVFLIAVTGWGDVNTIGEIGDAGFDVCLTKPVGYKLFTQHIHAIAVTYSLLR